MCGIVGVYYKKEKCFSNNTLLTLIASLQIRGPDESAYWEEESFFLGHTRLSIIDLSSGQQPMATQDSKLVVTFNGEIYNYIELRELLQKKGHQFKTNSDTEVLLHGYKEWGTSLPQYLIGMFAFAIADRNTQSLFIARDRFGEKPIYYSETEKYFLFASELKTMCLLSEFNLNINPDSLLNYLNLNYNSGYESMIQGIQKLRPGNWKLIDKNSSKEESYYDISKSFNQFNGISFEEAKIEALKRIDESIKITLRSDVGIGIFLSGGIDSTLIASRAVQMGKLERAFSVSFAEKSFNEYDSAAKIANQLGIPIEKVEVSHRSMQDFMEIATATDDPLGDSSCLPVFELSRYSSKKNKVVIGGDAGDEIFGGYLTYKATKLHDRYFSFLPIFLRKIISKFSNYIPQNDKKVSFNYKLMRFLRASDLETLQAHFTWNGAWLLNDSIQLINPEFLKLNNYNKYNFHLNKYSNKNSSDLRNLQIIDINEYMQNDILIKLDRMSMSNSLEVRSPFLHPSIVEFGVGLPEEFKISKNGISKYILRSISEDIFGKEFSRANKQGFSIPIHKWLRNEAKNLLNEILSEKYLKDIYFLNTSEVLRKKNEHLNLKKAYGFELWGLMVLSVWFKNISTRVSYHKGDISRIQRRVFLKINN